MILQKKVKLAKQFKAMTDALDGNKLLTAKVVPEFQIFLTKEEIDLMSELKYII